jgi:hypothetical protein
VEPFQEQNMNRISKVLLIVSAGGLVIFFTKCLSEVIRWAVGLPSAPDATVGVVIIVALVAAILGVVLELIRTRPAPKRA